MFDKFTAFLTLACILSTVLAVPIPQNTASADNLQPFTGALGGQGPPSVKSADNGFTVEGNGSFTDLASALAASCTVLKTQCTNACNTDAGRASGLTLAQCEKQDDECRAAIASASSTPATLPVVNAPAKNTPAAKGSANPSNPRNNSNARRAAGGNVQPFNGALGGQAPPAVTSGGRGFQVAGGDSFPDLASALGRSCDLQKENCLNAGVPANQCDEQSNQCRAAIASTPGSNTTPRPQAPNRPDLGKRQGQGQGPRPNGNAPQQNQPNQQGNRNNGNGAPQPPRTTTLPPVPPQDNVNNNANANPPPPAPTNPAPANPAPANPANRQPLNVPQ